jgi:GMP synthase (glutamine-hydrolysing)
MTSERRILCVYHATQREDRVSRMLGERDFMLDWVNPARGESLPEEFDRYLAVVVYGGEQSVNADTPAMRDERDWISRWVEQQKPYLGLCLGAQLLAHALGARIERHPDELLESGYTLVYPENGGSECFPAPMYVFQWHNEGFEIPANCTRLARGNRFVNQAFSYRPHMIGLQFHPEVTPGIMYQWFCEGGHMLTDPGAQNAEMQLRDAHVFEPGIESWTSEFLDRWITHSLNNAVRS